MQLTEEILAPYIGGQLEVQSAKGGYLFRGEVENIFLKDIELFVHFAWLVKDENFPPATGDWKRERLKNRLQYAVNLKIYSARDLGPSEQGGDARLGLFSAVTGETAVFFPPNGSKLDLSKIQGF